MKISTLRIVVGVTISLVFLFVAFKNVNTSAVFSTLRTVNVALLVVPVVVSGAVLFLKTLRWRYMLVAEKRERLINLFSVMMVGYFGNAVLPARMGEVLRIYTLEKNYGYNKSLATATVVVEKLCDLVALLAFLAVVSLFAPVPLWLRNGGVFLATILMIIGCVLFLFANRSQRAYVLLDRVVSPMSVKALKLIKRILENFQTGLRVLKNKKAMLVVMSYSIGIWLAECVFVYVVLESFNTRLSLFAPVFLTIMVNVGMLIPSAPGYIGTYQVMCITALASFGVEKDVALSMSIVLHIMTLFITSIVGISCFLREHMKMSRQAA